MTTMAEDHAKDQAAKRLYQGACESLRKLLDGEDRPLYPGDVAEVEALRAKFARRIESIDGAWN